MRNGVNATRLRLPDSGWDTVLDYVLHRFGHVDPEGIRRRFRTGEVQAVDGTVITETTPLGVHEFLWYYRDVPHEDPIPGDLTILHQDEHLLAVDKPHFLPTTPGGRFVQQSALVRLRNELGLDHLVPIHRLDRATAGVLLFSTNEATRGAYQVMFERRHLHKVYEAVCAVPAAPNPQDADSPAGPDDGTHPALARFPLVFRNRMEKTKGVLTAQVMEYSAHDSGRSPGGPARPGRKTNLPPVGANAETRMELIRAGVSAGTWAGSVVGHVRLFPRTGKTHQLRVHLAALGLGILGDPFYPVLQDAAPDDHARPLQLLARSIGFTDPLTGRDREFTSELELQERPR